MNLTKLKSEIEIIMNRHRGHILDDAEFYVSDHPRWDQLGSSLLKQLSRDNGVGRQLNELLDSADWQQQGSGPNACNK